ncbi:fatty acid desaturase [bacterium]|nr:fatty acid desaturase [bacterium]
MRGKTEEIEWPTLTLLVVTYLVWGIGTLMWSHSAVLSILLTGVAIAQFSSLQHEALHGHPFRSEALNEALVFPALAVLVPYRRFRDTHLQHHFDPALTDPHDDPESNFWDPQVWSTLSPPARLILKANNTLLGRIVLGPLVGTWVFLAKDISLSRQGNRDVLWAWALNLAGLVPVLIWLHMAGMPLWAYPMAIYLGLALLKIRTYLEHRAHEACRARTVIIEDRGPLSLLFLNNNFHVVHHMHPKVAWYKLPGLYRQRKEHYIRRNEAYVYANYAEVFRRYFVRAKDPVPHPVWPVRKDGQS